MDFGNIDFERVLIGLIVIVISITCHEFGHAFAGDRLGDPLPRRQGRVTLWPDKHFDTLGFIMIVFTQISGFGLGWGKPVQIDGGYFKNPRRDDLIVTLAGPGMNLLLALIAGTILRLIVMSRASGISGDSHLVVFLFLMVMINLSLMFFNLLPIFPLDGSHIMKNLLPDDLSRSYMRFMVQWGPMILLGLIFMGRGILSSILAPAVSSSMRIILGMG